MHIGIEAHQATRRQKTGTERYTYYLIEALAAIDRKDRFTLYAHVPFDEHLTHLAPNVTAKILSWPPRRGWTQTRMALEMLLHPPDVLFVPSHALPFLHPRKTVTTVHDLGFLREGDVYSAFERRYNTLMQRIALQAHQIIVPSTFTKQELLSFFPHFPEERIHVIFHGFTDEMYHPVDAPEAIAAAQKKYHLEHPYFLFTSRIEKKKNIQRLLEAFQLFSQRIGTPVQMLLAGRPDATFANINDRIAALNLTGKVFSPGFVPNDDMPLLMNGASAFVYPSLYEGFGFPVLEAQSCGIPVLTSNAASMPEIAGDAAVFVDPHSVASIADGMHRIFTDMQLRAALHEKGKHNVTRFRWEQCAQETLAVLRSVC